MAYELTFFRGFPSRGYGPNQSPQFSGSTSTTASDPMTIRFDDDDGDLDRIGTDGTPATLLEEFSLTIGNNTYTYPAGTEVALSPPTIFITRVGDENIRVTMHGLLVNDNGTWKPIIPPGSGKGYPGMYIFSNAHPDHQDEGKVIDLQGTFTANSIQYNRGNSSVPYSGQPDVIDCFTAGTLIDTPDGPRKVEDLAVGDQVLTRDRGPQPLTWIGRQTVTAARLLANPKLQPVRIGAGALSPNHPQRDLIVSPQHRILLRSRILRRITNHDEVLVPACQLVGWPGIDTLPPVEDVTYLHLMLPQHEVIRAEGAWAESLYLGPEMRRNPDSALRREIAALFPALLDPQTPQPKAARPFLRGKKLRELQRRAAKNHRHLVEKTG